MEGNKSLQKAEVSQLTLLKKIKDFIKHNDISVEDALNLLNEDTHIHDDYEEVDAGNNNVGRLPLLARFRNWPYNADMDDVDDVPAGRSVLSYKGIFYNFNSSTMFPQGKHVYVPYGN